MFGKKKKLKQDTVKEAYAPSAFAVKEPNDSDGPFTLHYKVGKYSRVEFNKYSTFKEAEEDLNQIKNGIENRNFHILSVYNPYDTFWIEDRLGNKYSTYERTEMLKADKDKRDREINNLISKLESITGKKVELK